MTKYLKIILISFLLICGAAYGDDALPEDCGLIDSATSRNGKTVEPENFEICEQDISFKVFYMLFGDTLKSESIEDVIEVFVDIPDGLKVLSKASGLGVPISSIYQAITYLIFSIGTLMIIFQTGKYIYKAQGTSDFLQNKNKQYKVAIQGLMAIALIAPIGDILVIQFIIFMMAIIGIMIANFILSGFLSGVEVKSSEVKVDESSLFEGSDTFAKNLVSQKLCQERTSKSILNLTLAPNTPWTDESPDTFEWGDNEMEDFNSLAGNCLAYYGRAEESLIFDNQLGRISINRPDLSDCGDGAIYDTIEYFENAFGQKHNCGLIEFNWPDLTTIESFATKDGDKDELNDLIDLIDGTFHKGKWGPRARFNTFVSNNQSGIESIIRSEDPIDEKKEKMMDLLNRLSEDYKAKFSGDALLDNEYTDVKNNKLRSYLIYIGHIAVTNYMLGGYTISDNIFSDDFNDDKKYDIAPTDPLTNNYFGVDGFRKKIGDISRNIEQGHCSYEWENLQKARKTIKQYQKNMEDPADISLESFLDDIGGEINFECMTIGRDGSDFVFESVFIDNVISNEFMVDIDDDGGIVELNDNRELIKSTKEKFENQYSRDFYTNASVDIAVLSGYHYVIKKALAENLSEKLKEAADFSITTDTRQAGWASLGSMMLVISKNMSNANQFSSDLQNTGAPSSASIFSTGGYNFTNVNAFSEGFDEEQIRNKQLLEMNLLALFRNVGVSDVNDKNSKLSVVSDEEEAAFTIENFFHNVIESLLFSPINYIKMGSNMDQNLSLVENLKECSRANDCISSDVHPLNSMMMFGHALLDKIVQLLLIKVVVGIIESALEPLFSVSALKDKGNDSDQGIDEKKGKVGGFIKTLLGAVGKIPGIGLILNVVGSVIYYAVKIIGIILNLISPLLIIMLVLGVICGYFIPTMPYVFFTIVFISWLVSIFVTTVSAPLWILRLSNIKEDGNTSIGLKEMWQVTGVVLLKPALITIAMVFAWTLASVSLFFINSTMYAIIESTITTGNFVITMISYMISYILYIVMIYIVIQHTYQIITKFSDDVSRIIGIQGVGDQGLAQSLQVERLLSAALISDSMSQIIGKGNEMGRRYAPKAKENIGKISKAGANKLGEKVALATAKMKNRESGENKSE